MNQPINTYKIIEILPQSKILNHGMVESTSVKNALATIAAGNQYVFSVQPVSYNGILCAMSIVLTIEEDKFCRYYVYNQIGDFDKTLE